MAEPTDVPITDNRLVRCAEDIDEVIRNHSHLPAATIAGVLEDCKFRLMIRLYDE